METRLLQSESKKAIKTDKKPGLNAHYVSRQDMEDIGLAKAMKKGRAGEYVDTTAYLKKLKSK